MKNTRYALAATLLIATALAAAEAQPHTLTVTGTAEVNVTPDICYMSFSVVTENVKNAVDAYRQNSQTADKVRAAIKAAGIEDKDIQSAHYSITPGYHWDDKAKKRIFDGYTVTHALTVNVRDLDKVSDVLDAAVTAGATTVDEVNFTVENPKKYTADARVDALKAARTKAEVIAKETDVKLLKPISIYETEPGPLQNYFAQTAANAEVDMAARTGGGAGLEPGQTKLTHTVTITYEIQ